MRLILIAASVAVVGSAEAGVIPVTGYDIHNARPSGYGGWSHTYTGTITPLGPSLSDYTGGSGTLNDGNLGTGVDDTQLFQTSAATVITAYLGGTFLIDTVTLFSFDAAFNDIPGNITGFDVTIGGQTLSFSSTEPTTHDEFVDLSASALGSVATDRVIFSNFKTTGSLGSDFSIAEIQVTGDAVRTHTAPEPGTLALMGLGSVGMGFGAWRKRRARIAA